MQICKNAKIFQLFLVKSSVEEKLWRGNVLLFFELELNFEKFTGDSLGEENFSHYFRKLIDGLEITPLVQRGSTLPVL